jgi:hypothetical protein
MYSLNITAKYVGTNSNYASDEAQSLAVTSHAVLACSVTGQSKQKVDGYKTTAATKKSPAKTEKAIVEKVVPFTLNYPTVVAFLQDWAEVSEDKPKAAKK